MSSPQPDAPASDVQARSDELLREHQRSVHERTDRLFAGLMLFQWLAGIAVAAWISPLTWSGAWAETHLHLWAAILLGGAISAFPIALAILYPGRVITRHAIAVGQALTSALLIHLCGGRIETHFHVFGSLAFLAFYRDWRVLISFSAVVAVDHLLRGLFWPQSVFGVLVAAEWRWLEHAGWVVFEDVFLISSCVQGVKEMRSISDRQAELEHINWMKTAQAELNDQMRGELVYEAVAQNVVDATARYLDAQLGALYAPREDGGLEVVAGFGWSPSEALPAGLAGGEGLIGEVVRAGEVRVVTPPEGTLRVSVGVADLLLRSVLVAPLMHEQELRGVLVLASSEPFSRSARRLVEQATESVATYLDSARIRRRTRELLAQTQQQAVELRKQMSIVREKAALDAKNLELEAASRHKSEFLASMSHELRTPLNAMIGYTSLTLSRLRDKLPERDLTNLTNAERSARTLLALLNDVLDFSKIEAGRMDVSLEPVDLEEVVDDCLLTGRGLLDDESIELVADLPPDLPEVVTDFTKLKQVLSNLVSNAIKVTERGSVTIRVEPLTGLEALRIAVIDTGPGIPQDKLSAIFESFKQLDGSTRRRLGGTGLGLAIAKRLCDLLGIEIGVDSVVGEGSSFWLTVPLRCREPAPAPQPEPPEAQAPSTPGSARPAPPPSGVLSLPKLVLGYDPEVRATVHFLGAPETGQNLQEALGSLPLRLEVAGDLTELIARAGTDPATWAVVVDPDGPGLSAIGRLKQEESTRDLPVVLCAAEPERLAGPQLVEALSKPVEPDALVDAMLRATRLRRGEVLVVEDDAASRELYAQVLGPAGFTPRLAADGEEALAWLREHERPQAILLDLLMPGLDGFQVLKALEAEPEWANIPVAIVTGMDLSREERELLERGSELLIEKRKLAMSDLPRHLEAVVGSVEQGAARDILVIDDNRMNLEVLSEILEHASYRVLQAGSAREGIELACRHRPDAVLMDLAMPGMDGFEATEELRRRPETADAVVIACSAFSLLEHRTRAGLVGCDGFITKPVEPGHLVRQVRRIILFAKVKRLTGAALALTGGAS